MKFKIASITLIMGLLLAACAPKATPTDVAAGIYTAVAQTLTAQYTPALPTDTPAPTIEEPTATPAAALQDTPTPPPLQPTLANSCEGAAYVTDVTIPDGTSIAMGATFTKTWTIKNTGTCAWTSAYALKFASGNQLSGGTTAIGSAVAAGSSVNVSISMKAPTTPGTYTGYWRMVDDGSTFFGGYVSVNIIVPAATMTFTPTNTPYVVTATPGPTNTFTSTPAPTNTSTSTLSPTDTFTPTPTT